MEMVLYCLQDAALGILMLALVVFGLTRRSEEE